MDIKPGKDVYCPISGEVEASNADVINSMLPTHRRKFMATFLEKHAPLRRLQDGLHEAMRSVHHYLDKKSKPKKKYNRRQAKKKVLPSAEKKRLRLFEIKPEQQKFSLYEPLHQLWKEYMDDLVDFSRITPANTNNIETRLLRADYHGAYITVTQSKCPSFVGNSGIVIQETRNVFKIISKDDRLKTIPKENSVFTIQHSGKLLTIYGNHFCVRASDRVTRKFKAKASIDL